MKLVYIHNDLLHVSANHLSSTGRCVTKDGYIEILQKFLNQWTDVKHYVLKIHAKFKIQIKKHVLQTMNFKTWYFTSVHWFTNFF